LKDNKAVDPNWCEGSPYRTAPFIAANSVGPFQPNLGPPCRLDIFVQG
jgi:hypothetical protein